MGILSESVSIIIPAYNAEKYLKDCIESIIPQLSVIDEVIVVDDGSKDRTSQIVHDFNDYRIKYLYQNNSGVSAARNHGLRFAKGDWIMFVDADDKLHEDCLYKIRATLEQELDCLIFSNTTNENWKKRDCKMYQLDTIDVIKTLLSAADAINNLPKDFPIKSFNLWSCLGKVYKKSTIMSFSIEFDKSLFSGEDLLFNVIYFSNCKRIDFMRYEGYFYRLNPSSVTAKFQKNRVKNTITLVTKLEEELNRRFVFSELQTSYYKFVVGRVIACYRYYFMHVDNTKSMQEKKNELVEFISEPLIHQAIQKSDISRLSLGKRTHCEFMFIVILLKLKQYTLLLNHRF